MKNRLGIMKWDFHVQNLVYFEVSPTFLVGSEKNHVFVEKTPQKWQKDIRMTIKNVKFDVESNAAIVWGVALRKTTQNPQIHIFQCIFIENQLKRHQENHVFIQVRKRFLGTKCIKTYQNTLLMMLQHSKHFGSSYSWKYRCDHFSSKSSPFYKKNI